MAGPTTPAWDTVDLIHAEHAGATPALNINGWMDVGAYETVKLFEFQQHHPEQYLIMAPTEHCKMTITAPDAKLGDRPVGDTTFPYDEIVASWFDRLLRDAADDWKPMPKVQVFLMGAEYLAHRRHLAAAGDRAARAAPDQRRVGQYAVGRRRAGAGGRTGQAPTTSSPIRITRCPLSAATSAAIRRRRSAPISDPSSAAPTCWSTARRCWTRRSRSPATSAPSCTSRPTSRTPTSSSSWSTSIRTASPTTWPRPRSGCATGTAWSTRPTWCPARSTGSRCAGSPRRTTSRPGTGSGSRSRARASRSPTGTGIPAAPTSTRLTVRSRNITLHHGAEHPSRIVYRAYTGPVEVGKKHETAAS